MATWKVLDLDGKHVTVEYAGDTERALKLAHERFAFKGRFAIPTDVNKGICNTLAGLS